MEMNLIIYQTDNITKERIQDNFKHSHDCTPSMGDSLRTKQTAKKS